MLYNIRYHLHNYFINQCNFLLKQMHQKQKRTILLTWFTFQVSIIYIVRNRP